MNSSVTIVTSVCSRRIQLVLGSGYRTDPLQRGRSGIVVDSKMPGRPPRLRSGRKVTAHRSEHGDRFAARDRYPAVHGLREAGDPDP